MRTTITLDSDVEALVKKVMAERGLTFKDAVNGLLRSALVPTNTRADISFATFDLGEPVIPLDHALRVASELEDDEIVRKLSVGR
jgi:hypothetical protein